MSYFNTFFGTDDFNSMFPIGFGIPSKIIFNTNGLKDMMPSFWTKTDNGYKATVKTLGLDEADIEIVDCAIKVSGKNTIDGKTYDTVVELPVAEAILDNVYKITHETKCGLTFIELFVEEPEVRKNIEVVKI